MGSAPQPRGLLEAAHRALGAGAAAEAGQLYQRALKEAPGDADALFGLGNVALALNQPEHAVGYLRLAIERRPIARFYGNLGIALHRLGRLEEAISAYGRACKQDAAYTRAYIGCGHALREAGRPDEAIDCLVRALELDPGNIEAHNAAGLAYTALGRHEDAERSYRNGIRLIEQSGASGRVAAGLHFNLGNFLFARGRIEQAQAAYESATQCDARLVAAYCNLAKLLRERGDLAAAARCLGGALDANPGSIEVHTQLGIVLLAQGDFARGWPEYEWRLEAGARARHYRLAPEWGGEELLGKTLYVFREQGISDEILFASTYEELTARAGRCVIECRPKLLSLFARSIPRAEFVAVGDTPDTPAGRTCDYQTSAGSIGRWLRPGVESFPPRRGYLRADAARVAHWGERLRVLGGGPAVGISWRSSIRTADRRLEYSDLGDWKPVFSVPGVSFVCLQYDECAAELAGVAERFGVTVHRFADIDLLDDLDEVAALIAALDLVISAPTAVSRQAAALGKATWQVAFGCDWRRHGTQHNLWLPSLRTFSRGWNQPWLEVLAAVGDALGAHAAHYRMAS